MQHDITGITCGAGTVSWTAHRPPGSFSNSSFYFVFCLQPLGSPTHCWPPRSGQSALLAHTLFIDVSGVYDSAVGVALVAVWHTSPASLNRGPGLITF